MYIVWVAEVVGCLISTRGSESLLPPPPLYMDAVVVVVAVCMNGSRRCLTFGPLFLPARLPCPY